MGILVPPQKLLKQDQLFQIVLSDTETHTHKHRVLKNQDKNQEYPTKCMYFYMQNKTARLFGMGVGILVICEL